LPEYGKTLHPTVRMSEGIGIPEWRGLHCKSNRPSHFRLFARDRRVPVWIVHRANKKLIEKTFDFRRLLRYVDSCILPKGDVSSVLDLWDRHLETVSEVRDRSMQGAVERSADAP
jgi:hypothetical protein